MASLKAATRSSPFTQLVVRAIRKLYPEELADKSFDNTGLLLEAPHRPEHLKNFVLLTNDLTTGVAEEAIRHKSSIVIAYHPIIFRALKSLTLQNSQQATLLRLAQEGISVYCPHTAIDAAPGGLNDWLADIVSGRFSGDGESAAAAYRTHKRSVIVPVKTALPGFEGSGYGRIVRFAESEKLGSLVSTIASNLGKLRAVSVAVPQSVPAGSGSDIEIKTVGICAGSGGSMLGGLDVDLIFTGELSHHEALAAIEAGKVVVTAFHSNTERAYLQGVMREKLKKAIREEMVGDASDVSQKKAFDGEWDVLVSKVDRDPFVIVGSDGRF